ncbi:hypothetical protein [Nocardioides sediminis]|uniref:hypothetical protein n=1 Tax=Nocardioides sediminis TaxID=433648 RepID=UPI000D313362|nr:hypothetical protein [Nocardioides sediminis]
MIVDLILALTLAVWLGLWLLRDHGRLGPCRSSTRRRMARHLAVRRTGGGPAAGRDAGPGALLT